MTKHATDSDQSLITQRKLINSGRPAWVPSYGHVLVNFRIK